MTERFAIEYDRDVTYSARAVDDLLEGLRTAFSMPPAPYLTEEAFDRIVEEFYVLVRDGRA